VSQVCATAVHVLAGMERITSWQLAEAAELPHAAGAAIAAACSAGPYLALLTEDSGAVLLSEAAEGAQLVEVPGSAAVLRSHLGLSPSSHVTAIALYHDRSQWLRVHAGTEPSPSVREQVSSDIRMVSMVSCNEVTMTRHDVEMFQVDLQLVVHDAHVARSCGS
jgi:hypothetical protein